MRTLIVEIVRPNDTEVESYVTKDAKALFTLISLGLDMSELLECGMSEFLTDECEQYRVTTCDVGTFTSSKVGVA